jgi:hypothetical protein
MRVAIRSVRTFFASMIVAGVLSCAHAPPPAAQIKDPQVTINVDAEGLCHYSISGMPNPKAIACDALKYCIDNHVDPASDACESR